MRSTLAALTALGCTLAVAPPATATGYAHSDVFVLPELGGFSFRVCVAGFLDALGEATRVTGTWRLVIAGRRHTTPFLAPVWESTAARISPPCQTVDKFGATTGEFTVTLTYVGVGGDVIGGAVGGGAWNPLLNPDLAFGTSN